jgi:ubiquinone/menaquinone biosynthesis C-methylase UbiE
MKQSDSFREMIMPHDSGTGVARAGRRQAQAAAFDQIGERYDEAFPHKEGQEAAISWLIGQLKPGARILDAGCGTGLPAARQLTEAGIKVTGIDISPVMVSLARQNVPQATFTEMDIMDLTPQIGEFDAVAAFFSLLMLPRREIPLALARFRQVLVPHGRLVVGMVEADVDDVPIPFLGAQIRVAGYPRDKLRDVVTAAGFAVLQENSLSYDPASAGLPPETQVTLCCQRTSD